MRQGPEAEGGSDVHPISQTTVDFIEIQGEVGCPVDPEIIALHGKWHHLELESDSDEPLHVSVWEDVSDIVSGHISGFDADLAFFGP